MHETSEQLVAQARANARAYGTVAPTLDAALLNDRALYRAAAQKQPALYRSILARHTVLPRVRTRGTCRPPARRTRRTTCRARSPGRLADDPDESDAVNLARSGGCLGVGEVAA